jgi:hypothetical protein
MKLILRKYLLTWIAAIMVTMPTLAQPAGISVKTLLAEMLDRETVARWPSPDYRQLQASSYDRRSVEKNKEGWFANEDWSNYLRLEINQGREEYVLMDEEGPGVITRFWTGGHPNQPNNLRFYIDGEEKPFWHAGTTGELIGQNKSIGTPLSQRSVAMDELNMNPGAQPGHNLYAPIPFAKRIKITSDKVKGNAGTGFWYQINYRLYDEKVAVESFSEKTPLIYKQELSHTNDLFNHFMDIPAKATRAENEKEIHKKSWMLSQGNTKSMTFTGTGAVRRISVSLKAENMNLAVKNTWIRIAFDGSQTVDVPFGFFFGCGDQLVEARDWYRKADTSGELVSLWVMPYEKDAVIEIVNKGYEEVEVNLEAAAGEWNWDDNSLYFHAAYKRLDTIPARTTSDFNYLTVNGQRGIYAGDILQVYKSGRGWWGEGDEKIYIDGSTFPNHFGTGTEDYYGYAWGHPETFNNMFYSQPIAVGNRSKEEGITVNSRVRSLDVIPFRKSLVFDMEAWNLYGSEVAYSLACFWYAR